MLAKYKILGILGLLIATFAAGYKWCDLRWSERVAEAEKERITLTLDVERAQKQTEYLLLDSVNDILNEQEAETEVVYREKIIYRNSPSAGTCKFPVSGVQIINDSAGLPRVSGPSATPKAPAKEVSDIEVVDVVSANYRMCRKELAKYSGLWNWAESMYNINKQK